MKIEEKEVVASVLTDCTPLSEFASLDIWWSYFKKRYAIRKKELKQINDLEKEISDD